MNPNQINGLFNSETNFHITMLLQRIAKNRAAQFNRYAA